MKLPENLIYPEQKILYFFQQLKKSRFVETHEISQATNLRNNMIFRHLRWFIKAGLLRQEGTRKEAKYKLTSKGSAFLRLNGVTEIVGTSPAEEL
jgi:predicted transcriptional regulator